MGRLILGFDGGCMTCSELADRIEDVAGDRLEVMSLSDPQMREWRTQALGEDGPWAPTLVEVDDGEVKAHTGVWMGVRLARRLGPVTTWRVMEMLGDLGAARRAESSAARVFSSMGRGQFIKGLGGAVVGISVLFGFGVFAVPAGAKGKVVISEGTPALRNKAKAIVRSSKQFKDLAARLSRSSDRPGDEHSSSFDFERAEVVFANNMSFSTATVPTVSETRSVAATFLIDLQNHEVPYYYHVISTPVGRDTKRLTIYLSDQTQADSHILLSGDYVVDADGRRLSSEQFVSENGEPERTTRSNFYCVDCPQAACTPCRRQYYDICLFVVRRGGCGAFGLVVSGIVGRAVVQAVCSYVAGRAVTGCRGGCTAYANSACF